jgi:hypothetical protein
MSNFGTHIFLSTQDGQTALHVICSNRSALIDAADRGISPIRVISDKLVGILGDNQTNSQIGRLIREQLQPTFRPCGRKKWPRENGTESGSIYKRR